MKVNRCIYTYIDLILSLKYAVCCCCFLIDIHKPIFAKQLNLILIILITDLCSCNHMYFAKSDPLQNLNRCPSLQMQLIKLMIFCQILSYEKALRIFFTFFIILVDKIDKNLIYSYQYLMFIRFAVEG